jgi:glycosyltransferase involved in cell wall biosynthesis
VGEVGFAEKTRLLSRAGALLFPLQWDEPYGLVVAEAQACGTPVLSLRRGAVPELVVEGRTGWLRDHHLELVEDIPRLPELQPGDCRTHALEWLDIDRSVRGYEQVYARAAQSVAGRASRGRMRLAASNSAPDPAPVGRSHGEPEQPLRLTSLLTKESS